MQVYAWNQVEKERLAPDLVRQVIHTEKMTVARMHLLKRAVVPEHSHPNEQFCMVEQGALQFVLEGIEQVIRAGEALRIPPNVPHSVVALEDSVAVDLFSPPRTDWIRGDDAYLRR